MQCIKNNMRKGEGAQFFLHEISIKQRKWRVLYLVLHSRGFFQEVFYTSCYTL